MNNNTLTKTILTGVLLVGLYAYNYFRTGSLPQVPAPSPSSPTSSENNRNSPERPASEDVPQPKKPDADSDDTRPRSEHHRRERHGDTENEPRDNTQNPAPQHTGEASAGPKRDLDQDEKHHGHTLQRHIARSDEQLLERLKEETDISSASTWTDKETAERTIGLALEKNKAKIEAWEGQGPRRSNLAFDFYGDGKTQIGRSIHRGGTKSEPCYNAKVVLKADGDSYYVLTSYPEAR